MTLEVHSLASGSSGNAVLIQADGRNLLIDAGKAGRTLSTLMKKRGVQPGGLDGVLLTHEHDDHIRGIPVVCKQFQAPLVANRGTLSALNERMKLPLFAELATCSEIALGPFVIRSFPVSHDAADPVGFVIQAAGCRIAYATDCGYACEGLRGGMKGADLCILESNHDIDWLWRGPYPQQMKVRVASNRGHLSNRACADLFSARLEEDGPATIWLAHLSGVNNSPVLARRYVQERIAAHTSVPFKLDVALRDHPSATWRPGELAIQQTLF